MGDTLIVLLFTAVILAYVSYLLYMRLGSAGVARGRITRAIAELWLTFALVILSFAIVSSTLGPAPAGGILSSWEEIVARARVLPFGLQVLIGALLLASLLLFIHLMRSLQVLMREAEPPPPEDGGGE